VLQPLVQQVKVQAQEAQLELESGTHQAMQPGKFSAKGKAKPSESADDSQVKTDQLGSEQPERLKLQWEKERESEQGLRLL
jgi:hypothetical protein